MAMLPASGPRRASDRQHTANDQRAFGKEETGEIHIYRLAAYNGFE
jgi:hypothetical protein